MLVVESAKRSFDFIGSLPEDIPLPSLSMEPDGNVGMEWRVGDTYIVAGINDQNKIEWGGITPKGRLSGIDNKEIFIKELRKCLELLKN